MMFAYLTVVIPYLTALGRAALDLGLRRETLLRCLA
jgi:hypothetical protein